MKVAGIALGPNAPARGLRGCRSERDEQALCDDFVARLVGREGVVSLSQARESQVHIGLPDRRYRLYGFSFFFETKAEDGKLTMSQHEFLLQELRNGGLAICGTLQDLQALAVTLRDAKERAHVRQALPQICLAIVGTWAAKGYRPEPRRRPRGRR